jgi:hypothetical protein
VAVLSRIRPWRVGPCGDSACVETRPVWRLGSCGDSAVWRLGRVETRPVWRLGPCGDSVRVETRPCGDSARQGPSHQFDPGQLGPITPTLPNLQNFDT